MSEEKSNLLGSQKEPVLRQRNKPVTPIWSLFVCAILATAWFTRLHFSYSTLSIEERVQKILSHTPLIGKEKNT
jgi:membrane dipeptidase